METYGIESAASGLPGESSQPGEDLYLRTTPEFREFAARLLRKTPDDEISEEYLYAALVEHQLEYKDPSLADAFRRHREDWLLSLPGGPVPSPELTASHALASLAESGTLDPTLAEQIHAVALRGSLLVDDEGDPDHP